MLPILNSLLSRFIPALPILFMFTTAPLAAGCEPISGLAPDIGKAENLSQGSYMVEYSEKDGAYAAFGNPNRPMAECEQVAIERNLEIPKYTRVCQTDLDDEYSDRYGRYRDGRVFLVGEGYFVIGDDGRTQRGKWITKDDMEIVIRWGECVWDSRELSHLLQFTDDQDPDDTIERLLRQVPYNPNQLRNIRLGMKQFC